MSSSLTAREQLLVEAIADRVADLLRTAERRSQLVDAATVARMLGVTRDCVYAHASELGARRIGDGTRGRLRFDLDGAVSAWTARSTSKESQATQTPAAADTSSRRRDRRLGSGTGLLPIRGPDSPNENA
jgi:hypothetical protein